MHICLHNIKREVSTFSFLVGTVFSSWSDIDFFFFSPSNVLYALPLVRNEKWQNVWERGRKRVTYSKGSVSTGTSRRLIVCCQIVLEERGSFCPWCEPGGNGSVAVLFWLVSDSKTFVNCRVLWWHNAVVMKTRLVIPLLIFLSQFAGCDNTRAASYRGRMNCKLSEHADGVNGWMAEQKAFKKFSSCEMFHVITCQFKAWIYKRTRRNCSVQWTRLGTSLSSCLPAHTFRTVLSRLLENHD